MSHESRSACVLVYLVVLSPRRSHAHQGHLWISPRWGRAHRGRLSVLRGTPQREHVLCNLCKQFLVFLREGGRVDKGRGCRGYQYCQGNRDGRDGRGHQYCRGDRDVRGCSLAPYRASGPRPGRCSLMSYRTMGESPEGCSLTTYRSLIDDQVLCSLTTHWLYMRGKGRERSELGRVTKKGKSF
jgi:hypothetical protein